MLRDFAADGVVYLELRTTPRVMERLTKEQYVCTILDTMTEFEVEQRGKTALERGSGGGKVPMHARLILSIDRRNSLDEAREAVDLAKKFREKGVVRSFSHSWASSRYR